MAKRSTPIERQPAKLTLDQIERGIARIEKRIADLEAFDPAILNERFPPEVSALKVAIEQTLSDVLGPNSIEYNRYRSAAVLDSGPLSLTGTWGGPRAGPDLQFRRHLEASKQRSIG